MCACVCVCVPVCVEKERERATGGERLSLEGFKGGSRAEGEAAVSRTHQDLLRF